MSQVTIHRGTEHRFQTTVGHIIPILLISTGLSPIQLRTSWPTIMTSPTGYHDHVDRLPWPLWQATMNMSTDDDYHVDKPSRPHRHTTTTLSEDHHDHGDLNTRYRINYSIIGHAKDIFRFFFTENHNTPYQFIINISQERNISM